MDASTGALIYSLVIFWLPVKVTPPVALGEGAFAPVMEFDFTGGLPAVARVDVAGLTCDLLPIAGSDLLAFRSADVLDAPWAATWEALGLAPAGDGAR